MVFVNLRVLKLYSGRKHTSKPTLAENSEKNYLNFYDL